MTITKKVTQIRKKWQKVPYKKYEFTEAELIEELRGFIKPSEVITSIAVYKEPLSKGQLTYAIFNHQYAVFQTNMGYWWSMEKNCKGITIQRSQKSDDVVHYYGRNARATEQQHCLIKRILVDSSNQSLKELIEWLYSTNQLNNTYFWGKANCKHFARTVFYHCASSDKNVVKGFRYNRNLVDALFNKYESTTENEWIQAIIMRQLLSVRWKLALYSNLKIARSLTYKLDNEAPVSLKSN